ncbi:MAG: phosphoribosylglycinamide formyltransferase [Actinomycetaceae bacterium]|nr:phosphoribosylglycinamide formyltransferase [Actinomycetaceae bacterium]
MTPVRLAVFASGTGSNFRAICESATRDELGGAQPVLLITNRTCPAQKIAAEYNVPAMVIAPGDFASATEWNDEILRQLRAHNIELIALAGYLRIVGRQIVDAYEGRILNVHPSVLPAYPGLNSIERVYADAHSSSEKREQGIAGAGVTVHVVDNGLDTGPAVIQRALDVLAYETLADYETAVHRVEHEIFPAAIAQLATTVVGK